MLTSEGYVSLDEAELIMRVIAGGSDYSRAADLLFRPYNHALWRDLNAMLHNDDDVDECLQEMMIQAVRNLTTFRGASKFSTWCTTIARRVAYKVVEERIRDRQVFRTVGKDDGPDDLNDLVDAGEPDIGGTKNLRPDKILQNKEMEDHIVRLLKECRESISRDPDTGKYDPLLECLTNGWIRTFLTNPEATLEEIGDACGTDHNRAKRVRAKLAACIKAKTGMEWVAERKPHTGRKP